MPDTIGWGNPQSYLSDAEVAQIVAQGFAGHDLAGKRVLVIIPDGTRTAPIPLFFRLFHDVLWGRIAALDYLVALGTHQPMSDEALRRLVGAGSPRPDANVHIYNHAWDDPAALIQLGAIPAAEVAALTGGLMAQDVPVTLNRRIMDYDLLVICGPTFPHEVVGFSGGNKYFFPGISGPDVINLTHWLGALLTSMEIIGTQDTPVRAVINRAAAMIERPKLCFAMVVKERYDAAGGKLAPGLAGLFAGPPEAAFAAAAGLSAQVHIQWTDRRYRRVLAVMPAMYDDIWTGAKGMYKLEPVVEDGGEVVIYAPHITEISYTHGRLLEEIGYHCRDYFVGQWGRFSHIPGGVLAHSTHLKGQGSYDPATGIETSRIRVTLATGIARARCERLNLGYLDPAEVDPAAWANREDEGILLVPKAGEMLYRPRLT
jgi:nickel-dependent lactate racemase